MQDNPIVLFGAGRMGGAMLAGWLAKGYSPDALCVVDPQPAAEALAAFTAKSVRHFAEPPEGVTASVLVLAVKPQIADDVLGSVRNLIDENTVVVSIIAGKTTEYFEELFGEKCAVVRAMPNTPAQVGRAATAGYANARVNDTQKLTAGQLLASTGTFHWVIDEALLDAVTAVSGSGPAYVFHMVEALAAAGVAQGLPDDLAQALARQTVVGAGELMHRFDDDVATLRQNVTSPGGTTEAALAVLMGEDGLGGVVERAVTAAAERSRELG